jgi:hypothetical protein
MDGLADCGAMKLTGKTKIMASIGHWKGGLRRAGRVALAVTATAVLLLSLVEVPGSQATGASAMPSPLPLIAAHP